MENIIIKNGYGFRLSEDKQKLFIFTVPSENLTDLSPMVLKQQLKDEKCSLYVDDSLLAEFISRFQSRKEDDNEELEVEIGYVKDASLEIQISKDKINASLWLIPSFGGKKITLQNVKDELERLGVKFGVVADDILSKLVNSEEVGNVIIAQGIEPINGVNSHIESLLPEETIKTPTIQDDDSVVDYRELGDVLIVKEGDLLAERIPATKGSKGINVLGETVDQVEGQELPLQTDSKTTHLNPENKDQLLSSITGQPIINENGASVSPVLNIDSIDLSTGNVRFDGSIVVANDVESGMTVFSAKDIVVNGDVISSKIECLGDLFIKGSVIGNCQLIANGNVQIKKGAQGGQEITDLSQAPRIVAMKVIVLGFVENFVVESDDNIVIEQYALNCNLMAENIEVRSKSKRSSLVGGVAWATNCVKAPILGNSTALPTKVCVGLNPRIQTAIDETETFLEQNQKKQNDVQNTLGFLEKNPTPENNKKKSQLNFILNELKSEENIFNLELSGYKSEMTYIENPRIIVGQQVNIGTTIQIRKSFAKIQEASAKTTFYSENGKIKASKWGG
jgi:uncharacterized protein (DUF342 family)